MLDQSPALADTAHQGVVAGSQSARSAQVRSLLVPLDGSPFAEQAIPYARLLAETLQVPMTLVSAARIEPFLVGGTPLFTPYGETLGTLLDDEINLRRAYLDEIKARLLAEGLTVTTRAEFHYAPDLICGTARGLPDALIVMTTHGRTGLRRVALGSVANEIVCLSEHPVLLVRPQAEAGQRLSELALKRWLVTLDGSPLSEHVLPTVFALAGPLRAEITLLRVVPRDGDTADAHGYLEELAGWLAGRGHRPHGRVAVGEPAGAILAVAEAIQADLVAMASHGYSGITRWRLGSTTDRVVQASPLPILVVRATPPPASA